MLITNIFYITHIVVFLLPIQYFYISILHKQDFNVNDTGLPTPTNIYPQGTNYITNKRLLYYPQHQYMTAL